MRRLREVVSLKTRATVEPSFFADLARSAEVPRLLYKDGMRDEATLLCCCYIKGLANALYWPNVRHSYNFCSALFDLSEDRYFDLFHVLPLKNNSYNRKDRGLMNRLEANLGTAEWSDRRQFETACQEFLAGESLQRAQAIRWKGTMARLAYARLRTAGVHEILPPDSANLDGATYRGKEVPILSFERLHSALSRIMAHARDTSLRTGKWFGHDFRT